MRALDKAGPEFAARRDELKVISQQIKEIEESEKQSEQRLEELLLYIPNTRRWTPRRQNGRTTRSRTWGHRLPTFPPKAHWDIGEALGLLDFERATKVAEPRFAVLYGALARLERALVTFFLDVHTREHGYREVYPPFMVSGASMTGTGQLPKFAAEAYKIEGQDRLVPTAEAPVTRRGLEAERCRSPTAPTPRASAARPARTARTCAG
jgi:seryl-tRNA synthetase